jgi:hypothetical protein
MYFLLNKSDWKCLTLHKLLPQLSVAKPIKAEKQYLKLLLSELEVFPFIYVWCKLITFPVFFFLLSSEINDPMAVPIITIVVFSVLIIIGIGIGIKLYLDQASKNLKKNLIRPFSIEREIFSPRNIEAESLYRRKQNADGKP